MTPRGALSPVGRETLHHRVYAELRRSLIHGMLDAGASLRIQDLAATLQTSTMPVREALGRLVSEQALESMPNRTVRVPLITREKLDDLARARCLIEGEMSLAEITGRGHDAATVQRVWRMLDLAEYKRRQAPPGVKITRRAFGRDRRYPITNAFRKIL